jgi:hypothetical protein
VGNLEVRKETKEGGSSVGFSVCDFEFGRQSVEVGRRDGWGHWHSPHPSSHS